MAALAGGWRTETSPDGRVTMYVSPQGMRLSSSEFARRYPVLKAYPESEWAAILHQTLDLANEGAASAPFGAGVAAVPRSRMLTSGKAPAGSSALEGMKDYGPPTPSGPGSSLAGMKDYGPPTPSNPFSSLAGTKNYGDSASASTNPVNVVAPNIPPPPPGRAPMPVPVGVPPQGAQGGPGWLAQNWGKVATGAGLAAGGAASLLRGQSGQTPKTPQQQWGGMSEQPDEPYQTPVPDGTPVTPPNPPTSPRGNGTERRNGYQAPRAAGAGAAQPVGQQNVAFAPNGSGGVSAHPNYYADMMNAADSGDAYARDQIRLTEQARQAAIEAQQRGDRYQFVPIRDYRNNRMTLVNANGADVVLDMSDPTHKAEYTRMLEKIGMNPAELQSWSMRSSRPLMRYFAPAGGHVDTTPDFAFAPGTPQMGQPRPSAQPAGPASPQAPHPGRTIRDLLDGPTPHPIMQPRRTIHSLDDMPPAPAQRHMEPDADQMGGPSDQDADDARPSMSVGDYMSQYAPGDEEQYRRLGAWDYDTEQPRTGVDRLQGALTADLNKRAARQPLRQTARR